MWKLKGIDIKMGLAYLENEYGKEIGNNTQNRLKVTRQFFF